MVAWSLSSTVVIALPPLVALGRKWLGRMRWTWVAGVAGWRRWQAGGPQGQDPGHDEGAHQGAGVVGIGQIGVRSGVGQIGQDDAHRPLGRPRGLVGREPAGEERGGEVAGDEEDPVHVGEGQMGQDHAGLVRPADRPGRGGR